MEDQALRGVLRAMTEAFGIGYGMGYSDAGEYGAGQAQLLPEMCSRALDDHKDAIMRRCLAHIWPDILNTQDPGDPANHPRSDPPDPEPGRPARSQQSPGSSGCEE